MSEGYTPRWVLDPKKCSHMNDEVCEMCDFDGYYASNYPSCPWRKWDLS